MKLDNIFSVKDYFNYYISGSLWCVSILLLAKDPLLDLIKYVTTNSIEAGGLLILGGLLLLLPYVVGFTLLPTSKVVINFWRGKDRRWHPDPRRHILITEQTSNSPSNQFGGERISARETEQIRSMAKQIFGIEYKRDIHLYFLPIRAYSLEYGGATAQQAERGRDLQNFTQSLLIPVPLLLIAFSIFQFWGNWLLFTVCVVLAFILHWILVTRYFELESYWVKHVYRSFLVITSKYKHDDKGK